MGRIEVDIEKYGEPRKSEFTGGMLELLGIELATAFVSGLTFGIAYPWMLCWKQNWYADHTYINGKQMHFDGTGAQLLGNWLKWLLLSIVTLGIYLLWLPIKVEKWTVKHIYFDGSRDRDSKFTGGMLELLGIELVTILVSVLTLGIAYPWMLCWKESWYAEHTYINGEQLHFNGKGEQLIGNWLKWLLFTIITFGIYLLWLPIKVEQWSVKHTYTGSVSPRIRPEASPFDGFSDWVKGLFNKLKGREPEWKTCSFCEKQYKGECCPHCSSRRECPNCRKWYRGTECPDCAIPFHKCSRCGRNPVTVKGELCAECRSKKQCRNCRNWYMGEKCPYCRSIPMCSRCGKKPVMMDGEICEACEKREKGIGFFVPDDL